MPNPFSHLIPQQPDSAGLFDHLIPQDRGVEAPDQDASYRSPEPKTPKPGPGYVWAYGRWLSPEEIAGGLKSAQEANARAEAEKQYADEGGWTHRARSFLNGVLLGGGAKAAAGLKHLWYGTPYDQEKMVERAKQAIEDERNPVASTAAQIVGGGAGLLLAGPERMTLEAIPAVSRAVAATPTLVGRLAAGGAAAGAPAGAVAELASKDINSADDVASLAAEGLVKGGVGGAALAPVAYGAARTVQSIRRLVADALDPNAAATRKIAQAVQETGATPAELSSITQVSTETPLNLVDATKIATAERGSIGADAPVTRLARAAAGVSGDGAEQAALTSSLMQRQHDQAGRMIGHVDRAVGGRAYEDEVTRLTDMVEKQARQTYERAHANAKPFDLTPSLERWRQKATEMAPDISKKVNAAIDQFYRPGLNVRAMDEGLAGSLRDRAFVRRTADPYGGFQRRTIAPIQDTRAFMEARFALDDQISSAARAGNNRLAARLGEMRRELNDIVRTANPELLAADRLYAEGRGSQDILEMGAAMTARLGDRSRTALATFDKMTPQQQDLFRLGFARALKDRIANSRSGSVAVANQLRTPATEETIRHLFPGKQGDRLVESIRREAVTSETMTDILRGSRTAPLMADMQRLGDDAQIVGDLLHGNVMGVAGKMASRVGHHIGARQAGAISRQVTETSPRKLVKILADIERARLSLNSPMQPAKISPIVAALLARQQLQQQ